VRSANRAFYKIFQVREEDTEGTLVYELGNRQWDIPQLRSLLEDVIPSNGQFHGFKVDHVFPSIGRKIMVLNARRIVQKIHRQQLVLLTIEDVTEYKQAQAEIPDRESWIYSVADNMPVLIWAAGKDKLVNFVNSAWLEFTGRRLEQEKGYGWTESIHKDDLESFLKVYDTSFSTKAPFRVRYRLRRYNGEYRMVEHLGKPIFNGKELTGYSGVCIES